MTTLQKRIRDGCAAPTTAELRRAAVRDIASLAPGIVPFGLMLGVTAVAMHAGALTTTLGAALVFGGSAQLTSMTLLHLGAGVAAALLSGAVVNPRIMLYGAALERRFRGQPLWLRLVAPQFIQDQTYLSAVGRGGPGRSSGRGDPGPPGPKHRDRLPGAVGGRRALGQNDGMTGSPEPRLTEERVLDAAGQQTFARGEQYTAYVRGLRVVGATVRATIQAKNVYLVEVDWSGGPLTGSCTCPQGLAGAFCKHQVAVALCVLDNRPQAAVDEVDPVATLLDSLSPEQLRALVRELVERDPSAARIVELRASLTTQDTEAASRHLVASVNDTLRSRAFINYRRSFEVARDAQEMLDELQGHLDSGQPDVVRPALLRAVTRLQKLTLNADDSGGVIGDACQRALDLYARSCREGTPDAKKLARWLVKFRAESPGWPNASLADFVAAFDDNALATYRAAVERLEESVDHGDRFERDRMRLELADHDGDVDAAVELLAGGDHPSYGAIVDRLRSAGRDEEALRWMDRAVGEGRVSPHGRGNEYWLDPSVIAETYLACGRVDDALSVLRLSFSRSASAATFAELTRFAERVGRLAEERAWALADAEQRAGERFGSGAVLIEIALREGDLDTAWDAAHRYGAGHLWQPLAELSAEQRPREAAELYRPGLEEALRHPDTSKYAGIADRLVTMGELYRAAGDDEAFEQLMREIRETYGRRPSLMAALDRRRLP